MRFVPSTQDLEFAAQVLKVLSRRGRSSFTATDFTAAGRARATARVEELLDFLAACEFLDKADAGWRLSERGSDVVAALARSDWAPYGRGLLGSGFYEDEIVRIVEASKEVASTLRLPLATVPRLAPSAGRIFGWDPSLREGEDLVLPLSELDGLLLSGGMKQAAETPDWVIRQNTIGWRAELYSLRLERSIHGAKLVLHVSRDVGDGFGYDIETSAAPSPRLIEVKGSRSSRVSFVITRKELAVARLHPQAYEVQFWGEIDLSRPPLEEYEALRRRGYPIVIADTAATIEADDWTMEPRAWQVRRGD